MSDWDIWLNTPDNREGKKAWAIAYEKQFLEEIENENN